MVGGLIHRSGGGGRNENAIGLIVDIGRDMVDDEATTMNERITILFVDGRRAFNRSTQPTARQTATRQARSIWSTTCKSSRLPLLVRLLSALLSSTENRPLFRLT